MIVTIFYAAGNFPLLNEPDRERENLVNILNTTKEYHRLVSFYYPKTVATVLQLQEEYMEEQKKGKTELDFEESKRKREEMAAFLLQKFPWMKRFRFKGDISYKPSRKKAEMREKAEAGEEVSYGLSMILEYEDDNHDIRTAEVFLQHKELPFYDIYFTAMAENPTIESLYDQWKDTWMILFSGGTPEKPKALIVAQVKEFPKQCVVSADAKGHRGRFKIAFNKYAKWVPAQQVNVFGESPFDEFDKIRNGK